MLKKRKQQRGGEVGCRKGRGRLKEDIKVLLSGLFARHARFIAPCKNIKICRTCKNGYAPRVCCFEQVRVQGRVGRRVCFVSLRYIVVFW